MATIFIFDLITTIDKNLYVIYNILYNQGVFIMENGKENNKVYIKPFIILFLISIVIFAIVYFLHSKNIENRFNRTLQNYEKSMSAIFNNIAITNGNNESINTNSFQTNNIENLKLSFEVGFKTLESSMNEIMKNSNDILQFWFAFLSVIMIVFTLTNNFINNSIFKQAKENLNDLQNKYEFFIKNINKKNNKALKLIKNIETEAKNSIDKIKIEAKNETNRLIQENNLFNFGIQAANDKDYKLAIYYFTEVVKLNPKNYQAFYNRGLAKYYLANDKKEDKEEYNKLMNEAIKDYDKSIGLNPKNYQAFYNIGLTKYYLANDKKEDKEEYIKLMNEAIKNYDNAISINSNYSIAFYNRGLTKYYLANDKKEDKEEYIKLMNEAIKDYDKSIELNNNINAYNNRGLAKYYLANCKKEDKEEYIKLMNEAIKDYDKSIELNNNINAYYNRGNAKIKLQKVEEAIKDFIKAYELNNNNEIKEKAKSQLINLAKEKHEAAIKFCEEHNINYNDNKE